MELKGRLDGISRDIKSGDFLLTLAVESIPKGVDSIPEGDLVIRLQKYREKRSLNANAYYWQLVGKMAARANTSNAYMHNKLLRRYGSPQLIDGQMVTMMIADTAEAWVTVDESEMYHLKPTSKTTKGTDGVTYRFYHYLKGSSDYDTQEMSRLIDGAVSEALEMGIEVLAPEELERMMAAYEEHIAK